MECVLHERTVVKVADTGSNEHVNVTLSLGWSAGCRLVVLHRAGAEDHVVTFREHDFVIEHPMRERLAGTMTDCEFLQHCADLDAPPMLGRYRVIPGDPYTFEAA